MKRSKHDRAVRGHPEYDWWKGIANFLDTNPSTPEIMRYIHSLLLIYQGYKAPRSKDALDVLLKDRYPDFLVMERLKGEDK